MKKVLFLFILTSSLLLTIVSCNKDDSGSENTIPPVTNSFKDNFFDIDNGKFNEENIPVGEKDPFDNITINKYVINGGKTILTLSSKEVLKSIIVGLEGQKGHFEVETNNRALQSNKSTNAANLYEYEVTINFSQKLSLEEFNLLIACQYPNKTFSKTITQTLKLVKAKIGDLQIALSWDKEDDLDLYLVDADENKIFFGHRELYSNDPKSYLISELDIDSNASCAIDGIKNENIYYKSPKDGDYRIYVDLFQKCKKSNDTGSKYIVNITYRGQQIKLSDRMVGKFPDDMLGTGGYILEKMIFIGKMTFRNGQLVGVTGEDNNSELLKRNFNYIFQKNN